MDACRSCPAPVFWATTTATGKPMLVNRDPAPDGNLILTDDPGGPLVTVLPAGEKHNGPLYKSHFATCPGGNLHRRRTR